MLRLSREWSRAALLLAGGLLVGCAPSEEESAYEARRALLARQNQGLRELLTEAESGSLVPTDRIFIGLDERVLGDLFRLQLPLERPLGKNFVIQLESAELSLWDKYGAITIEGNVHGRATPERKTAVRIHGGLGGVTIDPTTGKLNIRFAIDHLELLQAGLLEGILGRGGEEFLAKKGRGLLQDAIPTLEVPVALAQRIQIPPIRGGGFEMDSLVVPLNLTVERVIAAGGRMWVTFDAQVGKVIGAEEGVGVAVRKKPKRASSAAPEPAADSAKAEGTGGT